MRNTVAFLSFLLLGLPAMASEGQDLLLDPSGIVISDAAGEDVQPAVAAADVGFLVAWAHHDGPTHGVSALRVAEDGSLLDAEPFLLSTVNAQDVDVVWNGTSYLVTFFSSPSEGDPAGYGVRVSASGEILDAQARLLVEGLDGVAAGRTAAADNGWIMMVYEDLASDVAQATLWKDDLTEHFTYPLLYKINGWSIHPDVTFGDDLFTLVWEWHDEQSAAQAAHIMGRMTPEGIPLDGAGFELPGTESPQPPFLTAGEGIVLRVEDDHILNGLRVTSQMTLPGDEFPIWESGSQSNPALSWAAQTFLVTWDEVPDTDGPEGTDIWATRVTAQGNVLDRGEEGIQITAVNANQVSPDVASTDHIHLVVWQDYRNGNADIYAARVDTDHQGDRDGDGIPNETDTCPDDGLAEPDDSDGDGMGDDCEVSPPDCSTLPVTDASWMGLIALGGLLVIRRRG